MAKDQNPRLGRVNVMYGLAFVALSSLILRLGYLQIARGADFHNQATTTMLAQMPVLPSRGWIYDTNGTMLAYDEPSFTIMLTRLHENQDLNSIADKLAPVLDMKPKAFIDFIYNDKNKNQVQIRLLENADEKQVTFVRENQSELPGVRVEVEPQRVYKYGDLAGHVLGFVGAQSAQDRPTYANKNYYIDQKVGKGGIEKQYEDLLQGKLGERVVETNIMGVPLKDFGLDPAPTAGNSLQLTLDAGLQANTQQIIMDTLNQVRTKFNYEPKEASAIMIDPNTGGILSMASYPYYSPEWFMTSKDTLKHWGYLNDPFLTPTINHTISSFHAPGSTMKPVNLLAGLQTGVVTPDTTIADQGYAMVGNYKVKDDVSYGHGIVNPVKAIQVSCDTFFYYLGMWLANWHSGPPAGQSVGNWFVTGNVKGLNTLYTWESKFGLGQITGIDLPGEIAGKFYRDDPSTGTSVTYNLKEAVDSIKKTGKYSKHGLLYDNAAAAIGQMQAFTPIELAQYISAIANGGKLIQPHVLKAVLPPGASPANADGDVVKPKVLDLIQYNQNYMDIVKQGMYDVVNKSGGTAYGSFYNAPYKAAGKTGTAQVGGGRDDTSIFMAYAPADKPEVAVVVMVPGGGMSSDTAVPIVRQLFDAYFKEHHAPFFPKDQWTNPGVPSNWFQMTAYTQPESQTGLKPKKHN